MKIPTVLQSKEGQWVVLGLVVVGVAYYVLPKLFNFGAGLVSGNNALTQNQTDASGNQVTAYQGAGAAGTLGAAANSASGGLLASIGEWLGGAVADVTMPYDPNSPASGTNRSQVVTPNYINDVSQLGVGGGW
jgi:hypothetical protein